MLHHLRYPLLFLFLATAARGASSPQEGKDGANNIAVAYYQGLNIERWRGDAFYRQLWGSGGSLSVDEQLTVWQQRITDQPRQWKIDQRLRSTLSYPHSPSLRWLITTHYTRFLDQGLPSSGNSITSGHIGVGGSYDLAGVLRLDGTIGPLYEERAESPQSGYRLQLSLDKAEETVRLSARGWVDSYPHGSDYSGVLESDGKYLFSSHSYDHFSISYSQNRRRQSFDEPLKYRSDEQLSLTNKMIQGEKASLPVIWKSEMTRHRTTHSTTAGQYSDTEFIWINDLDAGWNVSGVVNVSATGGIDVQQQQYAGSLLRGRRTYLGLGSHYRFTPSDSVLFQAEASRYRFDTPSEHDLNDRDELRYLASLDWKRMWSDDLTSSVKLEIDLHHLVYLFRPRSGENRWSRLFRITGEVPWQGETISNRARFTASSHYTTYDYPPARESSGRVYRAFTAGDTLNVEVGRRLRMELDAKAVLDDYGRFRWSDWTEDISEQGFSHTISARLNWSIADYRMGWGWSWYRRQTTLFLQSHSQLDESVRSTGPVFHLYYSDETSGPNGLTIEVTGAISWVEDRLRGAYRLPDLQIKVGWAF